MDINKQLQPVVASLLDGLKVSMEQEIRDQVSQEVVNRIASTEIATIVQDITVRQLQDRVAKFNFEATSKEKLTTIVQQLIDQINTTLVPQANQQITAEINRQIGKIDVQSIVSSIIENKMSALVTSGAFPTAGIPHTAVNFKGMSLTGDQVKGGIIENFGSTGIEDRATFVQMTLMDHAIAFEGPIFAPSASIKGSLTVEGDLIIKGDIPTDCVVVNKIVSLSADRVRTSLNTELFQSFSNIIEKNIKESGIDLDRITQNGKDVVKGNQLGYHIIDTNIQRLGLIRDFQTQGENLLSDTLYVTTRRVGVNTMDPSATFVVWDEEVEMVVTKRGHDVGYIGTPRHQQLILGANNKDNLVLDTDGTVQVKSLSVGNTNMTSGNQTPNYIGKAGQIVWNTAPTVGGPIGWVCLGETLWAKFGRIE
jgi:hypothetical protein